MPTTLARALMAFFFLLACFCLTPSGRAQTNEYRGFWADAWSTDLHTPSGVSTVVGHLRGANMNTIVAQVRRRGDSLYASSYEPWIAQLAGSQFDVLADLIAKAHNTNAGPRLEVHAWIVTYPIWSGSTNSLPASHPLFLHPDWLSRSNSITGPGDTGGGNPSRQFDPGHPEVQRHTFNVAMDIISRYDVDGLGFDYVRYPEYGTGPNHQPWGYNPVSVARFNARYGRTGEPSPNDADWLQFRREQVTALVRKIYLSAMAIKPHVKISADTITWGVTGITTTEQWPSSSAYASVLQDWRGWMEEGILDLNKPMTYYRQTVHPQAYANWNTFIKDHQYDRHAVIGPGTYLNFSTNVITQLRLARQPSPGGNHARGMIAYSYRVPSTNNIVPAATIRQAFVQPGVTTSGGVLIDPSPTPIFSEPASIPEMPWKTAPAKGHLKGFVFGDTPANELDGAAFTLTGPVTRTNLSDATGFYGSVDLPPGHYTLTVSHPGYPPRSRDVTISAGVVTTHDVLLTTIAAPIILAQPQDQAVAEGADAAFLVNAAGTEPLAYQWRFEGDDIAGATSSSFTRENVRPGDAGAYSVRIENAHGFVVSANAALSVLSPPSITQQPEAQTIDEGASATFTVAATGSTPLTFQWRRQDGDLAGATTSSHTVSEARVEDAGSYSVVVANAVGAVTSDAALLTVIQGPPQIVAPPQNRSVIAGETATFLVQAAGSGLSYQWRHDGAGIPDATRSALTLSGVSDEDAGDYDVVVSNPAGAVESQPARLRVAPPFAAEGMEVLWRIVPGERDYVTTGMNERGLGSNPVNGNVLLVSRAGAPNVHVLNGDTGAHLHSLNASPAIVSGGQFTMNLVGVADDGVVYAGNLSISTTAPEFKLYRWENDSAATVPTLAFSGNPAPGTLHRWGDTLSIRGAGTNTQILAASRLGPIAAVLRTADGTNFASTVINVTGATNGAFGLSVAFGRDNTFWGRTASAPLRQVAFDLATGTGAIVRTHDAPPAGAIIPIGVSAPLNLLAGIAVQIPDTLHLFDLREAPEAPAFVASVPFGPANTNLFNVGAVVFSNDRIYAVDPNNGVLAVRILPGMTLPPLPLMIEEVFHLPDGRLRFQFRGDPGTYAIEISDDLLEWSELTEVEIGGGLEEFTDPATHLPRRFYRLKAK